MTKQISQKGVIPYNHIMLISRLEKLGLIVLKWSPDGLYRVLSEKEMIEWDINSGKWRDVDSDYGGEGIQQMIRYLGGFYKWNTLK